MRRDILKSILIVLFLVSTGRAWANNVPMSKGQEVSQSETSRQKGPFSSREKLVLNSIAANAQEIGRFQHFELTVDLSATYDNPFDPEDVELTAKFITPSGKELSITGFYYQEYSERNTSTLQQARRKVGSPCWKVRFSPQEVGAYRYYLLARDRNNLIKSDERVLQVTASADNGYIHPNNNQYLQFDSGKPFIAIGGGIGWAKNVLAYNNFFKRFSEHKCNYTRIWLVPWSLALEWTDKDWQTTKFFGIGKYSLSNAWKIDQIIQLAEEWGIYIVFTLGTYGQLMAEEGVWKEGIWSASPYNIANGGPCKSPEEFWSNEQARKYYKQYLRYLISRWGYSPNIFSFELWNEVYAPVEWTKEMAQFIKEQDYSRHMVTTSLGYEKAPDYPRAQLWSLPEIDYTQLHIWGHRGAPEDLTERLNRECTAMLAKYKKPCLVAEFGIDAFKDDRFYDKEGKGVNLHNGLWAGVFSGSFGNGASWWWDSYVDPNNLYYHYKALANFVETIDWNTGSWQTTNVEFPQQELGEKVRILGLINNAQAMLWLQNKQSDWYSHYQGIQPKPLEEVSFTVLGLPEGQYSLEWWDTYSGEPLKKTEATCTDGRLSIKAPQLNRDLAIKIFPNSP